MADTDKPVPEEEPPPGGYVTTGTESLAHIAAGHGTTPSAVLAATAADGFPEEVAAVVDEVFYARRSVVTPLPKGLRFLLPPDGAS